MTQTDSQSSSGQEQQQTAKIAPYPYPYPQQFEEDTIDLYELWITLWNGKWLVIAVTVVVALGSIFFALQLLIMEECYHEGGYNLLLKKYHENQALLQLYYLTRQPIRNQI